jgi:hypothetical protein
MAIDNFIPTIWSARLLANLHKAHVFAQEGVANKDYEGDINGGGSVVKINGIGAVTVGSYTKNTNISAPEELSDASQSLLIDQQKYFNFQIDDVDKAQQKPKVMDAAMAEAAYALRDSQDQYVAALHTDVHADNLIGSTGSPVTIDTGAKMYEYLVDAGVLLEESNVPREGRWAILPAWGYGRLLKDDRFVKAGTGMSDQVLRNGEVGQAAGFAIFMSNNVVNTTATKYKIMCGYRGALAVAEQIVSVEAYRPELRFADAVKGLLVYGAKVVRNKGLVCITANKS